MPALGILFWYAVADPSSQLLGKTIVCGPQHPPRVALTFDDGPGEETPLILDILKQAGIRATFFLCGENVERFPEVARRIAAEGHEIGNHTYSHPRLLWKSPGRIAWEIDRAQNLIAHRTGKTPKLFRPPYGLRWFGLFPILEKNGLQAVMWSVNGKDWRLSAREITRRVLRDVGPGAIVLLHDGVPPHASGRRRATVEALPEILRSLGNRFQFVPASEMSQRAGMSVSSRSRLG